MKDAGKLGMIKVFRGMEVARYDQGCSLAFGIDLGNTNSVAAVCKEGHVDFVRDRMGNIVIPSCVDFSWIGKNGICGYLAKEE